MTAYKRMEFSFKGKTYRFILNPEEYTMTEPNRITVTQTKGGAYMDDFGGGVKTISMKGTTGFKGGTTDPTVGFKKFKELRDLIRNYYEKTPPGTPITSDNELTLYNYTDQEYWVVSPRVFSLKRSVSRPLLFLYEMELVCQRPAGVSVKRSNPPVTNKLELVEVLLY